MPPPHEAVGDTGVLPGGGVVVPIANGSITPALVVPGTDGLRGVACLDAVTCQAVGLNGSAGLAVSINSLTNLPVAVSGSQTFGSSSPSFAVTSSPPPGDAFSGTLTCPSVGDPPFPISSPCSRVPTP